MQKELVGLQPLNDDNDQMLRANAFFQAKDYPRALAIYQQLLSKSQLQWEKSIIKYDIGSVLLAQKKWEEAIIQFEEISLSGNPPPFMIQDIKTNLALARLHQAEVIFNQLNKEKEPSLDVFNQTIFMIREALKEIDEAKQAECQTAKLEGYASCENSIQLQQVYLFAKELLASVMTKYSEAKTWGILWEDDVSLMLSAIDGILAHIDFLKKYSSNEMIQQEYADLFINKTRSWLALWETIELAATKNHYQELIQAKKNYASALEAMDKKQWDLSHQYFEASKSVLNKLLEKIFSSNSVLMAVKALLSQYHFALSQDPLDEEELQAIQVQQDHVIELIHSKKEELTQYFYFWEEAKRSLKEGIEFLKQSNLFAARLMLEEAFYQVKSFLQKVSPSKDVPPIAILKEAIEDQTHAAKLYQLGKRLEQGLNMNALLSNAQKHTVETSEPFLKSVFALQIQEFASDSTSCQCKPWDEALPLFNEGYQLAVQVLDVSGFEAITLQQKVLELWKKALQRLEQASKENTSQQQMKKNESPTISSAKDLPKASSDQGLELLREMYQQDQRKNVEKNPVKKGLRPW